MVDRSPRGHYLPFVAAVLALTRPARWAEGRRTGQGRSLTDLHDWRPARTRRPWEAGCTRICAGGRTPISRALAVKSPARLGKTMRPYDD